MRSPARPSVHSEAIEAELICKRAYVGDLVDHATAMVPNRPPVPGTIVRHRAHAQIGEQLLAWPSHKTTAGPPCNARIGNPSGSPHTANASVRPSGVSSVRTGSPTNRA